MKESNMNKELENNVADIESEDVEVLPEYDFSGGVRGKYAQRYTQENNIVLLDPDVAQAFPTFKVGQRSVTSADEARSAECEQGR